MWGSLDILILVLSLHNCETRMIEMVWNHKGFVDSSWIKKKKKKAAAAAKVIGQVIC